MANFAERGTGDAVVTYENEILLHNKEGAEIPYVIPPATLLIEGPAAVVNTSVESHGNRRLSPRRSWSSWSRSKGSGSSRNTGSVRSDPSVAPPAGCLPMPPRLFTMADLGGWAKLEAELYGSEGALDLDLHRSTRSPSRQGSDRRWQRARETKPARSGAGAAAGTSLRYLGVMVVLPMAALMVEAARPGRRGVLPTRFATRSPGTR